ncbi:MAG: hypothetical protein OHK93_003726 [Ramalina farinacea]|uniref:Uncharacterized protein n=1 Tax=Ramalina farinacea TaxID=258253 RepID=A0AA43U1I3_9LECA|nr:hypothetical protein [Ramalina farinacea]
MHGLQGSIISRDGDEYAPTPIDDNDPPQQPDDLPDDAVLASSISDSTFIEAPNCHNTSGNGTEGENVVCDYVGEDYQDYLKEMSTDYATLGGCELS